MRTFDYLLKYQLGDKENTDLKNLKGCNSCEDWNNNVSYQVDEYQCEINMIKIKDKLEKSEDKVHIFIDNYQSDYDSQDAYIDSLIEESSGSGEEQIKIRKNYLIEKRENKI